MNTETHSGDLPENIITFRRTLDISRIRTKIPALSMGNSEIAYLDDYRERKFLESVKKELGQIMERSDGESTYEVIDTKRSGDSELIEVLRNPKPCKNCRSETNFFHFFPDSKDNRQLHGGYCSKECFEEDPKYKKSIQNHVKKLDEMGREIDEMFYPDLPYSQ